MYEVANTIKIKDLPIMKSEDFFHIVEPHIEESLRNGVNLGEMVVNPNIYGEESNRLFDYRFTTGYICALNCMVRFFRKLFNKELFILRTIGIYNQSLYDINFHNIFNEINKNFNIYIDDYYILDQFFILGSDLSVETFLLLYEVFNNIIVFEVDKVLKTDNISREVDIKYSIYKERKFHFYTLQLYEEFYGEFDDKDIYLLFY